MESEIQAVRNSLSMQRTAQGILDRESMIHVDHRAVRGMSFVQMAGLVILMVDVVPRMVVHFRRRTVIG
jgi:hypothetical protein